ncbi:MAG: hypothetical protein EVJ47_05840 [Candidatus Acidulodesulfobacterium ferriphilum]|uniref:Uncharacterized protein n=1 Tax=Candidatus Acidulodesulfobacterium ferriphilum TaxID=2597223 RepID=A0A519BBT5_9DELT|nr:MAG: hypothetical protein EVJ47_05840 [Candidatus Acidulodesulfobacterium ferriphilum]
MRKILISLSVCSFIFLAMFQTSHAAGTFGYTVSNLSSVPTKFINRRLADNVPTWFTVKYPYKKYGIHVMANDFFYKKAGIYVYYSSAGLYRNIGKNNITSYYLINSYIGFRRYNPDSFERESSLLNSVKEAVSGLMNQIKRKGYPVFSIDSPAPLQR